MLRIYIIGVKILDIISIILTIFNDIFVAFSKPILLGTNSPKTSVIYDKIIVTKIIEILGDKNVIFDEIVTAAEAEAKKLDRVIATCIVDSILLGAFINSINLTAFLSLFSIFDFTIALLVEIIAISAQEKNAFIRIKNRIKIISRKISKKINPFLKYVLK